MIAVNQSREADVAFLLRCLCSQRKVLVAVGALRDAVGWDDDRFSEALADAENDSRVQTWEDPDGGLAVVLTPLEADRRGLELSPDSRRWLRKGARPDARHFKVSRKGRTVGEELLDLDTDGAMDLDGLPSKGPTAHELLIADLKAVEASFLIGPRRSRWIRQPKDVLVGNGAWPIPGATIRDISTPDAGVVRDLVVPKGSTCPACHDDPLDKPRCIVCDAKYGKSEWFAATIGVKQDERQAKAEEATAELMQHIRFEIDPKTGRRRVVVDPQAIKFQPRSRGARRGKTG